MHDSTTVDDMLLVASIVSDQHSLGSSRSPGIDSRVSQGSHDSPPPPRNTLVFGDLIGDTSASWRNFMSLVSHF